MVTLNLSTPMRLCHHLSKPMVERRKGTIIDIASIAGASEQLAERHSPCVRADSTKAWLLCRRGCGQVAGSLLCQQMGAPRLVRVCLWGAPAVRLSKLAAHSSQLAAHSLQGTACSSRLADQSLQLTDDSSQLAAHSLQLTACGLRLAGHSSHLAACSFPPAACRSQLTACSSQLTACSLQQQALTRQAAAGSEGQGREGLLHRTRLHRHVRPVSAGYGSRPALSGCLTLHCSGRCHLKT